VAVAVVNVGLNLWLITAYSWTGAVIATLVCDGLLAVSLWGVVAAVVRAEEAAAQRGTR
jgi:O-antigen/teichoic acid export membrane protein